MQTSIQTFSFNSLPVRIEIKEGEPLFCLTDVAEILNIRNANPSRFNMSEDGVHLMYSVDSAGRKNEITFINEPNLYRVIFRSRKEEAVQFQDWVFEEVLPQIRKTGQYQAAQLTLAKNNVFKYTDNALKKVELKNSSIERLNRTRQYCDFFVPSHIVMAGRATNKRPAREISPLGSVRVFDLLAAYSDARKNASGQALSSLNRGASL